MDNGRPTATARAWQIICGLHYWNDLNPNWYHMILIGADAFLAFRLIMIFVSWCNSYLVLLSTCYMLKLLKLGRHDDLTKCQNLYYLNLGSHLTSFSDQVFVPNPILISSNLTFNLSIKCKIRN